MKITRSFLILSLRINLITLTDYKKFSLQILKRGWILGSTSKKYLRFTTSAIKELVYINKGSNGWKNKESYLLELELYPSTNAITFKSVIAPSDENYNTSRLEEILREIDGFKKPIGKNG